jgi:hypothetical protein
VKSRGRWRRVLAGGYQSLDEARREAARLRATREFVDAQVLMPAPGPRMPAVSR